MFLHVSQLWPHELTYWAVCGQSHVCKHFAMLNANHGHIKRTHWLLHRFADTTNLIVVVWLTLNLAMVGSEKLIREADGFGFASIGSFYHCVAIALKTHLANVLEVRVLQQITQL
jgi:hypothetical protein